MCRVLFYAALLPTPPQITSILKRVYLLSNSSSRNDCLPISLVCLQKTGDTYLLGYLAEVKFLTLSNVYLRSLVGIRCKRGSWRMLNFCYTSISSLSLGAPFSQAFSISVTLSPSLLQYYNTCVILPQEEVTQMGQEQTQQQPPTMILKYQAVKLKRQHRNLLRQQAYVRI